MGQNELSKQIVTLIKHVADLRQRISTLESALGDVSRNTKDSSNAPQVGYTNPLQNQAFVDIVRVTSVDTVNEIWSGYRQVKTDSGSLTDSEYNDGLISGDKGTSSLPSVGDKITVLYTGTELTTPDSSSHSIIGGGGGGGEGIPAAISVGITSEALSPYDPANGFGSGNAVIIWPPVGSPTVQLQNPFLSFIPANRPVVIAFVDDTYMLVTPDCASLTTFFNPFP